MKIHYENSFKNKEQAFKIGFYFGMFALMILALITMVLSSCAHVPYTKQEIALEVAWQGLHVVDWLQTEEIAKNPNFYETNKIMGRSPSRGKVNTHMALFAVGHLAVSYLLPSKFTVMGWKLYPRKYWQWTSVIAKGYYVGKNYRIGVRF